MIDFHAHILPGIDDGPQDVEASLALVSMAMQQGTKAIVATPHFYSHHHISVGAFIERRRCVYNRLLDALNRTKEQGFQVHLGAEVLLDRMIFEHENIIQLCIENTRYMMIELPCGCWHKWVYEAIYELVVRYKVKPIIAHIDRYISTNDDWKKLDRLMEMDVLIQINTAFIHDYNLLRKHRFYKLLSQENIHFIGSDCHNTHVRKPDMDIARKKIMKHNGEECWERLMLSAETALKDEPVLQD